jgi:hypothetical protein
MHPLTPQTWLAFLTAGMFISVACTVMRQNERFTEVQPTYDEDGNIVGYKSHSRENSTLETKVDDRLFDALPGVIGGGDDDDDEDDDNDNEEQNLSGWASAPPDDPSGNLLARAAGGASGTALSDGSLPFLPVHTDHPGEGDPKPLILLQSITLDELDITLHANKTAIDDTDALAFTMVWNVDVNAGARQVILDHFSHAAFPDPRTVVYAGPAPEGFDLAALLGMTRIEMVPATMQIIFDSPSEEDPWTELQTLVTEISQADGTVSVNGTVVLQLTENAQALDALNRV